MSGNAFASVDLFSFWNFPDTMDKLTIYGNTAEMS